MTKGRVLSVQSGIAVSFPAGGKSGRTAIDKAAVSGRAVVTRLGIVGDEQADTDNHGGYDQALYAYAREDLDWWTEQTGRDLRNGVFGENLTIAGLDVSGALIGQTWRIGDLIGQVTSARIPCSVFAAWIGEEHWVKRFAVAGRPGAYLRVLSEGEVGAGDRVEVLDSPSVRVTVAESMRAYYGDADLMRALLTVPGRGTRWDAIGDQVLGRGRPESA